jgi:hypothetical protein
MKRKDNLGNQRFWRIMREWGILALLMIALHAVYFVGWALLSPTPNRPLAPVLVLTALYVIASAVIIVVFYRRVSRADTPVEEREARANGLPAMAKVLEIEPTGWRSSRIRSTSFAVAVVFKPFRMYPRRRRYEYQMRLLVTHNGAEYEAQLAEYLSDQIPEKGDIIPVKVHPQHPEVVVLALDDQ